MHLPDYFKPVLCSILLVSLSGAQAQAFTATDFNSSVQINEIDIAPTVDPSPGSRGKKPAEQPESNQTQPSLPSVVQNRQLANANAFFSLSLTSLDADFGVVDPTNPVIRTQRIRLQPGTSQGFNLLLYENHPLQTENSQHFIPDTTCDDGKCTENTASLWENTLTYGFGFRCDSDNKEANTCIPEFDHQQFYKQFADVARKESGAELLRAESGVESVQARITYKLNLPGTQAKGAYENTLVFIAAPRF